MNNKLGAPIKYNASELLNEFNKYIEYRKTQFDIKYDCIRSGERAGETIEIKIPKVPSVASFCHFIGITEKTFWNWINNEVDISDDLLQLTIRIREEIKDLQLSGAMNGIYNPLIASRINGLNDTLNVQVTEQPVVNINLNALTGSANKQLNENNIQDVDFIELDPIELSQNNTILTDNNESEMQMNVNE